MQGIIFNIFRNIKLIIFNHIFLLLIIIVIGVFLRSYMMVDRFEFAHDGDLYSWIVKDIVVNKHLRLIGQQTSTTGIFIGPFFYYLLVPFFLLTSMDPVGILLLPVLIGVATVLSYYFVFNKLFDYKTGIIASFLQAVLMVRVNYDRWIVPTITVNLWGIWYLYSIFMLVKGNFSVFPLLGFLVGLIWHINLSLLPILSAVPVAIFLSRKKPALGHIAGGLLAMAIPLLPYILFEARHGFVQTVNLLKSFIFNQGGGSGLDKFHHVFQQIVENSVSLFFYPDREIFISGGLFFLIMLISVAIVWQMGGLDKRLLVILYIWIFSVILFFTFSTKITSEYYFSIIDTAILTFAAILFSLLFQLSVKWKILTVVVLGLFLLRSFFNITGDSGYSHKGYLERKAIVSYISQDANEKGFPCVSVSYIASPGEEFGFRYLFFLKNLHVNQPKSGSPVYTIVSPADLVPFDIDQSFGALGVISPRVGYNLDQVAKTCSGINSNLTDPLFGYTQ